MRPGRPSSSTVFGIFLFYLPQKIMIAYYRGSLGAGVPNDSQYTVFFVCMSEVSVGSRSLDIADHGLVL